MKYSRDDHYRWGWGDGWFNEPDPAQPFKVQLGSVTNGHRGFRQESINVMKEIAEQLTKPLAIGLSGGFDSQVAVLAAKEAGLEFTPVLIQHFSRSGNLLNAEDVYFAEELCKRHRFKLKRLTLVPEDYYAKEALDLAWKYAFTNPETLAQLWVINQLRDDFAFVMAGGDPLITKNVSKHGHSGPLIHLQGPTPIQQYLISEGIEGVTKLFMYSPELLAAFFDNPPMDAFYKAHSTLYASYMQDMPHKAPWQLFPEYVKPLFYQTAWPELLARKKLTGFERFDLKPVHAELDRQAAERLLPLKKVVMPVLELRDHLLNGNGALKVWSSAS